MRAIPLLLFVLTSLTPAIVHSQTAENPAPPPPLDFSLAQAEPASKTETKQPELWDTGSRKNYLIPAIDIIGFDVLLNRFNRHYGEQREDYKVNASTVKKNLHSEWVTDRDPFKTNQLGHPYQGSMYHGFARSAGLNYWEASAYTFLGSAGWEIAGENTPPSKNDQIASGIGGSFLGEALFRIASLVLEYPDGTSPFWRELTAAVISPSTGFNRLAFGSRFDSVFSSNGAAYYGRFAVGASHATQASAGTAATASPNEGLADFSIDYGLPGQNDYVYKRPFDYFSFQATASTENSFENVMTRGLLFGTGYGSGNYRGVWGLYGSYDYISPQYFRISSTALSLGTTGQLWLSRSVALQGTAMFGAGYGAAGTLRGVPGDTDYHYGVIPQALIATRLIFGQKASLDLTGREYFVTRVSSAERAGHDNILRFDASFTWRIYKRHAIALKYLWNHRDASFPDLVDRDQTRATIGIYYTLLGHDRFGATDWR